MTAPRNGPSTVVRRFYRILVSPVPSIRDFMSNEELGISPRRPLSRREQDRWRGVSHMDSLRSAAKRIDASPWIGAYIAEIEIPIGQEIRIEQTSQDRNHFTLWADAGDLLSWVVSVRRRGDVL
jgi:hypothetical protein